MKVHSPSSADTLCPAGKNVSPWIDLSLLVLLAGIVFFTNLGGARLWDIDEPRNAGCALEMMQRGDWVTPIFNDELRGQKPVLLYWLMMSAYQIFGVGEFAARFWSAALGTGTVACTYLLGRHLFGRSAGLWSALTLSSTLMFTVASRAATPDAPLIFFSALSITLYVLLTFKPIETTSNAQLKHRLRVPNRLFPYQGRSLPIYVAMAVGVLAKGPIAAVLPCCVIGLFMMIADAKEPLLRFEDARTTGKTGWGSWFATVLRVIHPARFFRSLIRMQPWWLVFTVALIAAPWFIWAGLRTEGDFLNWFFFQEHLGRATTAMENHSGGPWFYPLAILVGFFPWSILAVPVAIGLWREFHLSESPNRLGLSLALVWVALQVTVFTLVSTKLPSYVTPCYPALALLCGTMLAKLSANQIFCHPIWIRGGFVALALVGIGLLVGLPLTSQHFGLQGGWLGWLGLIPLSAALLATVWSWSGQFCNVPRILAVGSWSFVFLFFAIGTSVIDQNRQTETLWSSLPEAGGTSRLASYRYLESSWVFYAKQPIWELSPQPQPLKKIAGSDASVALVNYEQNETNRLNSEPKISQQSLGSDLQDPLQRDRPWHSKPKPYPVQLVTAYPDSVILVSDQHLEELLSMLPAGYGEINRCRKFLKPGDLVMVGRKVVTAQR